MCDKMSSDEVASCVKIRDKVAPGVTLCAAGGINKSNCADYAAAGADCLVTSAVWTQGTCDLSGKIEFI